MSLEFRPARAEDADAAAPLVYSAGPEAFDYMFRAGGHEALDFLRYAFRQGGGFQGYRNHRVAEREGVVVGVGAFYGQRLEGRLTLGLMRQVLSFYTPWAAFGVIRRGLELAPMLKPLTPEMLYVANFGVAPECRGQGIGARMLNWQMVQARQDGYGIYALDVAVTNPRAQKLYEGIGFRFVRERRFRGDRARAPVPDCRRLEMKL